MGTTYKDLGILFLNQQQWDRAHISLESALEVLKPLAERYPRERSYRRHLAAVHCDLGEACENLDRWAKAFSHSQTAVALLEQLLREQPGSLDYMETLAAAFIHLANELLLQGKAPESQVAIDRAVHLLEEVRQREPRYGVVPELIPVAYRNRGDLHARLGNFAEAFKDWEQGALLGTEGEDSAQQTRLVNRALLHASEGEHHAAGELIDALRKQFPGKVDTELTMRIAWTCTLAAAAVRKDQHLGQEDRNGLAQSLDRKSVEALVEANRAGYFKPPLKRRLLQLDPILAPLRERPEVSAILNPNGP
jgi:tetratricopeptide (TPR) repeat protein